MLAQLDWFTGFLYMALKLTHSTRGLYPEHVWAIRLVQYTDWYAYKYVPSGLGSSC